MALSEDRNDARASSRYELSTECVTISNSGSSSSYTTTSPGPAGAGVGLRASFRFRAWYDVPDDRDLRRIDRGGMGGGRREEVEEEREESDILRI